MTSFDYPLIVLIGCAFTTCCAATGDIDRFCPNAARVRRMAKVE